MSCVQPCKFLLKNLSVPWGLEQMESMWVLNLKSVEGWIPRYLCVCDLILVVYCGGCMCGGWDSVNV